MHKYPTGPRLRQRFRLSLISGNVIEALLVSTLAMTACGTDNEDHSEDSGADNSQVPQVPLDPKLVAAGNKPFASTRLATRRSGPTR